MITAEYAPDGRYTRHSEGSFLRLDDGSILFIYSRFTGGCDDDDASDLAACVSRDGGESWSEPETVLSAREFGARNIMSVSLLRMINGDVGCFYLIKATPASNVLMLSRSNDGGRSFYSHVRVSPDDRENILIINNDRAMRLMSGRLLLPFTIHRAGIGAAGKRYFDSRGIAACMISDDDGYTWRESIDLVYPPFPESRSGLQENGAVELKNGAILGYSRTDMGCQYLYTSLSGGECWSPAQPSKVFTSPMSPISMKRNPFTDELFAVWNPIPNYYGRKIIGVSAGRTPLVYAVSRDEGVTWSAPVVIEDDADRGYCYTAIFFTDESHMLLAYCAGSAVDVNYLGRLRINKISIGR